ncbi:hypothetical protein AB205_0218490 [Aquarana catesbeiana]|uniref:Uncharacterized protein n=1 Tax=Aquarana catesbeiana TaxID=8400 RepID=A0A2G9SFL4_AQUCT|nr:hypothetical protein AB205_0218490 [Aquarana catesbeiana]
MGAIVFTTSKHWIITLINSGSDPFKTRIHMSEPIMPHTHNPTFRQQMSLLSEIPTVCRLHRTFFAGISDNKNLRAGSQIFRQQNPFSEIPIVCTQFQRTKFHACSESSRRAALAIELHFSQLVVSVVCQRVIDDRNFQQHLCDSVYARQVSANICRK